MLRLTTLAAGLLLSAGAFALSLADLTQSDASGGLKDALTQGAQIAVKQLGKPGGFSDNDEVRIELPGKLGKAAQTMKMMGMGEQVEELEASMNKAAEAAVPQAQAILVDAVKKMTVSDAKAILAGGEDSATQYLNKSSREQIRAKFLPIVKQATAKVDLADKYNDYAGKAANMGLLDKKDANLDQYVTQKALDGLYLMVAEQEKAIRKDPVSTGSALLKKIFGG